ncbi:unnamed protein product [Lathyrus oleraceus]
MIIKSISDPFLGITLSHDPEQLFSLSRISVHELLSGNVYLDNSVLQIWSSYIHDLCVERKLRNKYCILNPAHMGLIRGWTGKSILNYLKDKLKGNIKDFYFAPFYHNEH